ncbi:MAG: hypothetical protein HY681_08685 [Chloroflexi bacterium]|nr:hypothetical protein [Chloroflexota bacterium]
MKSAWIQKRTAGAALIFGMMALALVALQLGLLLRGASAQAVPAPVVLEGRLTDVNVSERTVDVMGIRVRVPLGAPINSPTAALTIEDLLGDSFPGTGGRPGFLGGTAIVEGETLNGVITAHNVFVEVAENVIVGVVTENGIPAGGKVGDGPFKVLGVTIDSTRDPRLPVLATVAGLALDVSKVPVGASIGVVGYLGSDGVFYALEVDADAADFGGASGETSITRVRCTEGGVLDIRGGTTAVSGVVTVSDPDSGAVLGTTNVVADLGFGLWRFKLDLKGTSLTCPAQVMAEHEDGSFAVANV